MRMETHPVKIERNLLSKSRFDRWRTTLRSASEIRLCIRLIAREPMESDSKVDSGP